MLARVKDAQDLEARAGSVDHDVIGVRNQFPRPRNPSMPVQMRMLRCNGHCLLDLLGQSDGRQ